MTEEWGEARKDLSEIRTIVKENQEGVETIVGRGDQGKVRLREAWELQKDQ